MITSKRPCRPTNAPARQAAPAPGLVLAFSLALSPAFSLALSLALAAAPAAAQQATERFIPLGQSPGVSGKTAMMGTVVGYSAGVLTLSSPAYPAPQQVRVSASTQIWLDRSALRQSNVAGSAADLVPGRRIEIRFVDAATRQAAAWIKIAIAI